MRINTHVCCLYGHSDFCYLVENGIIRQSDIYLHINLYMDIYIYIVKYFCKAAVLTVSSAVFKNSSCYISLKYVILFLLFN